MKVEWLVVKYFMMLLVLHASELNKMYLARSMCAYMYNGLCRHRMESSCAAVPREVPAAWRATQ